MATKHQIDFSLRRAGMVFGLVVVGVAGGDVRRAAADLPGCCEKIERLFGVGWGDGYHACRDSGCQPLADLPPDGYAQRQSAACCGAGQCRSGACGHGGCDSLWRVYPAGHACQCHTVKSARACDGCDNVPAGYGSINVGSEVSVLAPAPPQVPTPPQPPTPAAVRRLPSVPPSEPSPQILTPTTEAAPQSRQGRPHVRRLPVVAPAEDGEVELIAPESPVTDLTPQAGRHVQTQRRPFGPTRIAVLPQNGPRRDWNPVRQPD